MKTTVVVADDHELMRRSIASLLREEPDLDVVGECANGREALELIENLRPSVAVIDVAMPELNGIETTRRIVSQSPKTRVIVLSNYVTAAYVRGVLDAGAIGYIVKSGVASDLIQAVRNATSDKVYLSPEVVAAAESSRRRGGKPVVNVNFTRRLTSREREVLQLIAEGHSTKEIATALRVSETTIKSHRNNIMDKLRIREIAGLTRYAIRIGLVRVE